jgi:uncharacterized membrane protein YvlD (DUF360 family)
MLPSLGLIAVVGLALVHAFGWKVGLVDRIPRSAWLSAAAETSVAYVFVHLLPELAAHQEDVSREVSLAREEETYLAALAGLIFFYALEHVTHRSRRKRAEIDSEDKASSRVFWASTLSFALFNALLGYGLGRRSEVSLTELGLFTVVIGVHFLVNDAALRRHHKDDYDRVGRWILAGAIVLGWIVSRWLSLPALTVGVMFGFVAGGIVFNVLKEEVPGEQEHGKAFWAFVAGAVLYAVLLLLI